MQASYIFLAVNSFLISSILSAHISSIRDLLSKYELILLYPEVITLKIISKTPKSITPPTRVLNESFDLAAFFIKNFKFLNYVH